MVGYVVRSVVRSVEVSVDLWEVLVVVEGVRGRLLDGAEMKDNRTCELMDPT